MTSSSASPRLPSWIARHWEQSRAERGAPADRVRAGLAALEHLFLHTLGALAAASPEARAKAEKLPPDKAWTFGDLVGALAAARAASRADSPLAPLLPASSEGLDDDLRQLTTIRNAVAHGRSTLSDADVAGFFVAAGRVVRALAPIAQLPVFFVDSHHVGDDDRQTTKIVVAAPNGEEVLVEVGTPVLLPDRMPFLLLPDRRPAPLSPFVRVGRFQGDHHATMRLLPASPNERKALEFQFPTNSPSHIRDALPEALAARLLDPRPVDAPDLPGIEVQRELGRGGSGVVYAARSVRHPTERLAVKVLRPEWSGAQAALARFEREAKILETLAIRGVVRSHGLEIDRLGRSCLIMEQAEGRSAQAWMDEEAHIPWQVAVMTVADLLTTLQQVHDRGIVHRDLKPSNLWLDPQGQVRILDFGIAWLQGATPLTRTAESLGTHGWAAPEQIQGLSTTPRTDIYAVGRWLKELLTHDPQSPPALDAVVRYAMATDPDHRPASAPALIDLLRVARDSPDQPVLAGEMLGAFRLGDVRTDGRRWFASATHREMRRAAIAVVLDGSERAQLREREFPRAVLEVVPLVPRADGPAVMMVEATNLPDARATLDGALGRPSEAVDAPAGADAPPTPKAGAPRRGADGWKDWAPWIAAAGVGAAVGAVGAGALGAALTGAAAGVMLAKGARQAAPKQRKPGNALPESATERLEAVRAVLLASPLLQGGRAEPLPHRGPPSLMLYTASGQGLLVTALEKRLSGYDWMAIQQGPIERLARDQGAVGVVVIDTQDIRVFSLTPDELRPEENLRMVLST